jgi:hypothetical protein
MLSSIWNFLKDGSNQAVLSWIGGAIAAVAAGIWAVVKFMAKNGDEKSSRPSVSADHGSVAVQGEIKNSPINVDTRGNGRR